MSITELLSEHFHKFSIIPVENPTLVFLLVLLIILFSPLLFRKIKLPYIIGFILAGIVFGPHGLHILENDRSFELLGKVGILYIMFLAGLDLDLEEFKDRRYKSLVFGLLTFSFPLLIGFPVCYWLLGYNVLASLLTASMFSTHTLVSYPIVSDKNLARNSAVSTTVGGTILTDTAVLILLAIVINHAKGIQQNMFGLLMLLSIVSFLGIMFGIIPHLSKWFFEKFANEKQLHYIYVLSVMFFSAFIAEIVGLEDILGAFFAGLVLNKYVPHSSALMNRIDFIGNTLFIPFFLISVGMLVDVAILYKNPTALVIAIMLSIVAIASKWIAAWATQHIFKFTKVQRQLMWGLSSSHAAATLAIILAGYNIGLIDDNILNGTIILILITCTASSFITQRAAENMQKHEQNFRLDKQKREKRTLIPLANPQNSRSLIETAILFNHPALHEKLYALHIINDRESSSVNAQKGQQLLEEASNIASASDLHLQCIVRYDSNATSGIIHTIKENKITDVLLGVSSDNSTQLFLCKTTNEIQRETEQNIFIINNKRALNTLKRIVVAVPEHSEHDIGFVSCYKSIRNMARQLDTKVIFHSGQATTNAIKKLTMSRRTKLSVDFREMANWEDFLLLKKIIKKDDMLIIFQARKGTDSYHPLFEKIPYYIEKYFKETSTILIYPQQQAPCR